MRRFSIPRAPSWAYILLFGVIGLMIGLAAPALDGRPLAAGVIAAGLLAIVTPLAIAYWRRLDEAAREAHKFAWYWGGGAGMVAVIVAYSMLSASDLDLGASGSLDATDLVTTGMMGTLAAQLVGYLVAWAGWWLARR